MSRLEIQSSIPGGVSRVKDCVNLLTQVLSFKDLGQSDRVCVRASIALLFGADIVPDSVLLEADAQEGIKEIVSPALLAFSVLPHFPNTGAEFAACMSEDNSLGALVYSTVETPTDHVIGIIPESKGSFLMVDTNTSELMRRIDENELIKLYVNADIPSDELGRRSVVVFRDGNRVMEETFP